jgi:hypothetical protein
MPVALSMGLTFRLILLLRVDITECLQITAILMVNFVSAIALRMRLAF